MTCITPMEADVQHPRKFHQTVVSEPDKQSTSAPANVNQRPQSARLNAIADRVRQIAIDKGVTGPAPLILKGAVPDADRLPFPTPRNHGEEIANARAAFERSGSPHAV